MPEDEVQDAGVVDKNFQGQGIYRELNRLRLGYVIAENTPFITTTTQNPRIEKGVTSVLAEFVAAGSLTSYDIDRFLLPAFYVRRLISYDLESANTSFSELNMEAGDAFSLAFKLNPKLST